MAYTKNIWVDQDVERPKTYEVTNNQDGSITLTDSFGLVTELGTPVNAVNMNHIEDGIANSVGKDECIPEYDSSISYEAGTFVKHNYSETINVPDGQGGYVSTSVTQTKHYKSLQANNLNHALTDTSYWQEVILDATDRVKTTGDTMTGALTFDVPLGTSGIRDANPVMINANNIDFDTAPTSNEYLGMVQINDGNDNRMGRLEYELLTDGAHCIRLVDKKSSSENEYSIFQVGYNSAGNQYCQFPSTICVDGQWLPNATSIATNVNINGNSNLTYDLSASIPKDGYYYELLLWARAVTSTTSTAYVPIYVGSSLTADTYLPVCGMKAVNNVSNTSIGSTILPLGTDRKITLVRNAGYYGTLEALAVKAIRRIGTNS